MTETDSPSFVPRPDRDAWAAIRGYVYQVETTILRWLDLCENEELELECGEDIDIIQRTVYGIESGSVRTLEQVKHREQGLTLRSPSAIEALSSFFEHLSNNPKIGLKFRYVTNAPMGTERDASMPEGQSGLEAWKLLADRSLSPETQASILSAIRSLLEKVVPAEKAFRAFVRTANDSNLLNFIRSFEWSTGNPRSERLQQKIQEKIASRGLAGSAHESQQILDRLFVFTMRTLSAPGRKVLTPVDLKQQILSREMGSADAKLLGLVNTFLGMGSQLATIQQTTLQTQELLEEVAAKIDSFIEERSAAVGQQLPTIRISIDVPPSVDLLVRRESTISKSVGVYERATWYALQGEAGSGKTQFAILIAENCQPQQCVWIGLRNLTLWECCTYLELALAQAAGVSPSGESKAWYEAACSRLPLGALVVLDDLPRTSGSEALDIRLQLMAEACFKNGLKVLSTASDSLPPHTAAILGSKLVDEKLPLFTDDELAELIRLHGAPQSLLNSKFVDFLGAMTNRHPMLLTAACRYLSAQQWKINEKVIQGLFRREYGQDLKPVTRRLLQATVPDSRTREMLYRLNLVGLSFASNDITVACEVAPAVDFPMERLTEVLGLWVQKESDSKYSVSPLLANLGSEDLHSTTRIGVHSALGNSFFRKQEVGPADAFNAFGHFHGAGELERASALLTLVYSKLLGDRRFTEDVWGLTDIWADQEIPREVSLSGRLVLRGYQIGIRARLRKDVAFLLNDLDSLLESSQPSDAMAVVGACAIVTLRLFQTDPSRVLKYAVRAVKNQGRMVRPDGKPVTLSKKGLAEFLLVAVGSRVTTEKQIGEWLSALEQLSPTEIKCAFEIDAGEELCCTLCNGIWLRESYKVKPEWPPVLQQLSQIEDRSSRLGISLLRVGAIRAKIIVLAEYLRQLDESVRLASETLEATRGQAKCEFLINEIIGHQYLFAQKWDDALAHLSQATNLDIRSFPFLRMRCLLAAGQAASHKDRKVALEYCTRAASLAQSEKKIPKLQVVVAVAERAIASWYSNDPKSAFASCLEAAGRLFESKSDNSKWKEVFGLFGHVLGYFCSMSSTGKPPESDFEYASPQQGWFLIDHPSVAEIYDPARDWAIFAQLAIFAEALEFDEDASRLAAKAVEEGRRSGGSELSESLLLYTVPQAIVEERLAEALALAVKATETTTTAWVRFERSQGATTREISEYQQWDHHAALRGLVPIAIKLSCMYLVDAETCRTAAFAVAEKCRLISQSATQPEFWQQAAQILEQSFNDQVKWRDLFEMGNSFAATKSSSLHVICYLLASLHAPPAAALNLQLSVFPVLEKLLQRYSTYRRIVLPFVRDFWLRSIDADAFHFTSPRLVRARLAEVSTTLNAANVKQLLQIVAASLRVTPTEEAGRWLQTRRTQKP